MMHPVTMPAKAAAVRRQASAVQAVLAAQHLEYRKEMVKCHQARLAAEITVNLPVLSTCKIMAMSMPMAAVAAVAAVVGQNLKQAAADILRQVLAAAAQAAAAVVPGGAAAAVAASPAAAVKAKT